MRLPHIRARLARMALADAGLRTRIERQLGAEAEARAHRRMLDDPALLDRIVEDTELRNKLLKRIESSEEGAAWIVRGPGMLSRLTRSPQAFRTILDHLARNPEALYQMLSLRKLRASLPAQKALLGAIAHSAPALAEVLKQVPEGQRSAALAALADEDLAPALRQLDAADRIAVAVRMLEAPPPRKARESLLDEFVEALAEILGQHAPQVLAALLARRPDRLDDALKSTRLRDHLHRGLFSDTEALLGAIDYLLAVGTDPDGPPGQLREIMAGLLALPLVRRSLQRDPALRRQLTVALRDACISAGLDEADAFDALIARAVDDAAQ